MPGRYMISPDMGSTPLVGLLRIRYMRRDGKGGIGMVGKRDESATVDLKVRMKEPLRASLEEAARRRGVSMNAEAVQRLEQSFSEEALIDRVLGGREVRRILSSVLSHFTSDGEAEAIRKGLPPEEWTRDPECYRAATRGAIRALIDAQPKAWIEIDQEQMSLMKEAIETYIAGVWVREGKLKFKFKDGVAGSGFIEGVPDERSET
jgi:hypothetical protein